MEDTATYDSSIADSQLEEVDSSEGVDSSEKDTSSSEAEVETEESEDETEEEEEIEEVDTPVSIAVKDGEPSSVVAKQLQSEAIIENALEFDTYLEKGKVAKRIRPGKYEVTKGMDFAQIVNVLLRR